MLVRPSTAFALSHWCSSAGIQHCILVVSSAVARSGSRCGPAGHRVGACY